MPVYEYSCKKCGKVLSVIQNVNAAENDIKCRECGSNDMKKNVSAPSCSPVRSGASFGSSSCGSRGSFGGG